MLGAYTALIVALSFFHEMWRDEVRAWTVATDAPSWGAMFAELHHEGHPALWYVVLRLGYLLTGSRFVLPVSALLIAIGAAYVILRYSPFPDWLKAFAVFGAFLGYELSVSARNYGIGVLLMVIACALYPVRGRGPIPFALALALLANTSVLGAIAAAVILGLWLLDSSSRREDAPKSIAAALIVVAGIAIAFLMARPSADMTWATPLSAIDPSKVLKSILIDPGKGLLGVAGADLAAVSEYPWRLTPIDPLIASRVVVDLCLLWLLWNLRSSVRAMIALIGAVVAFEIFFRNVYTGGLRHEGVLLFLIFAICWIAVATTDDAAKVRVRRQIVMGLAPLFAIQALALPIFINRAISHQQSSSKRFGEFIRENSRYRDAILVGEPDYVLESMPYYVGNRIYMARQGEFARRVYFGESRRRKDLTLSQLQEAAINLSCRYKVPVLLAIGAREFPDRREGTAQVSYRATFTWTAAEKARLRAEFPRVAWFGRANTDEVYQVFETPACGATAASAPSSSGGNRQ
jgi:hypothetical protein